MWSQLITLRGKKVQQWITCSITSSYVENVVSIKTDLTQPLLFYRDSNAHNKPTLSLTTAVFGGVAVTE